jgi:hypothetical protein
LKGSVKIPSQETLVVEDDVSRSSSPGSDLKIDKSNIPLKLSANADSSKETL